MSELLLEQGKTLEKQILLTAATSGPRCIELGIGDLKMWERLAKDEFPPKDFCSPEYLSERWDKIRGWALLHGDGDWIGACFVWNERRWFNPSGVHFLESCIFPPFRGKGFYKYLHKIRFDSYIGCQKSMSINPENAISASCAIKYGFKKTTRYKSWDLYICPKDYYPTRLKELGLCFGRPSGGKGGAMELRNMGAF